MRKRPISAAKNGTNVPASTSSSSTRRQIVPNIAAAGSISTPKWADIKPTASNAYVKKEEKSPRKKVDGRKHGNSRRTANRGGGGNDGQTTSSTIVKSEGVFSCGIGTDEAGHPPNKSSKGRHQQMNGEEIIIGKLEADLHETKINAKIDEKKSISPVVVAEKKPKIERKFENPYEEIWQSDDEFDNEELNELVRENFISDLQKADQMPLVLPTNEASQFHKIIHGKKDEEDEAGMICDDKNDDQQEAKFLKAGKSIRGIMNSNDAPSPLMLFQIPSSIFRMGQCQSMRGENATNDNMMKSSTSNINHIDQQKNQQTKQPQKEEADQQKNCLEFFPAHSKIGKLQFLRSGRIVMNIGGQRMDIAEAIPSDCFETLLRIESGGGKQQNALLANSFHSPNAPSSSTANSEPPIKNNAAFGHLASNNNSAGHLVDFTSTTERRNIAHLLGPLPHQFVCSFDLKCILEEEMKRKREEAKLSKNNNKR